MDPNLLPQEVEQQMEQLATSQEHYMHYAGSSSLRKK
jgi:hypothetical protein